MTLLQISVFRRGRVTQVHKLNTSQVILWRVRNLKNWLSQTEPTVGRGDIEQYFLIQNFLTKTRNSQILVQVFLLWPTLQRYSDCIISNRIKYHFLLTKRRKGRTIIRISNIEGAISENMMYFIPLGIFQARQAQCNVWKWWILHFTVLISCVNDFS